MVKESRIFSLALAGAALLGCAEGSPSPAQPERRPALAVTQTGARTAEIQIAGPRGLRALQARLRWDIAALRVVGLEPGRESRRIDRVFFNDPRRASGSLLFGLTDTRKVQLPARGALLSVRLEPADAGQAAAELHVEEALGVEESGKAVILEPASAEVRLR